MENGRVEMSKQGTPQGGVISPLLADIYLHYVLDLGSHKVKLHARGHMDLLGIVTTLS